MCKKERERTWCFALKFTVCNACDIFADKVDGKNSDCISHGIQSSDNKRIFPAACYERMLSPRVMSGKNHFRNLSP